MGERTHNLDEKRTEATILKTSVMSTSHTDLQLIRMLTDRLERISADSVWAHRASGVRGALLRALDQLQNEETPNPGIFSQLIAVAMNILSHAAKRG